MKILLTMFVALFLSACSGCGRQIFDFGASSFGADWIIVQYAASGNPINCWKLRDVSVDNESSSDGIQWKVPGVGMMHLAGWYARVMVDNGNYESTFKYLGLDINKCPGGKYLNEKVQIGSVTFDDK